MKRFENAQVGDKVYSRLHGNGIIKKTTYSERYPLECFFEKYNSHREYTLDGRHDYYCEEAMLFYRKGEEKYLTERPEPEVDWFKIEEGTEIEVYYPVDNEWCKKIFYAYTPGKEYPIQTKLTEWFELQLWKKARLING